MTRSRLKHLAAWLAALLLPLAAGAALMVTAAPPAAAQSFYVQGDPQGDYLNWWDGTTTLSTWHGITANDDMQVVPIGGGLFELTDPVSGGCVGDRGGSEYDSQAWGGQYCPTTGTAGWGTRFKVGPACGGIYVEYQNVRWGGDIYFSSGDGQTVTLDGGPGVCLGQQDP